MRSKPMNNPGSASLKGVEELIDSYEIQVMVYDSRLDSRWVQYFLGNPGWEIEVQDREYITFVRSSRTSA